MAEFPIEVNSLIHVTGGRAHLELVNTPKPWQAPQTLPV